MRCRIAAGIAVLTTGSLLLRTGSLHAGYWIDEAISVGIASHPASAIPRVLRYDGSPPLYYELLHAWMAWAGTGEPATRALSLGFALLAVPVAWWAGCAVADRRAGALAAAGAAGCPFVSYYAQETRMYTMVAVLSLLACGSFAQAFLHGRRRHAALLGLWLTLLLYTHNWGLYLAGGMAVGWWCLWRKGRVRGGDGPLVAAAVAVAYLPWMPTLIGQASHTAAPWAERPSLLRVLGVPGALFGYAAAPLLLLAAVAAVRRDGVRDAARVLALIAMAAVVPAWAVAQVQPAWSTRYLAVLLGPLLLALAVTVARAPLVAGVALGCVTATWLVSRPPAAKSNVRAVAAAVGPVLRGGDVVVSTQPEQVPALARYLPRDVRFLTPLGVVRDTRQVDYRDGVRRLRVGHASRRLVPLLARLRAGRRVLLVTPVEPRPPSQAPWRRAVRARTREWRAALRADDRLVPIARAQGFAGPRLRSMVRAEVFEVRRPPLRRPARPGRARR